MNEHASDKNKEKAGKDPLIEAIVGAAYEVGNVLGAGFLEKIYEHALRKELARRGLRSECQVHHRVDYKGESVGEYVADLVVEGRVIVELKCAEFISGQHLAQCLNYLKVSGLRLGLVLNFQRSKVEWRRVVLG